MYAKYVIVLTASHNRYEASHKISRFATFIDAHTIQMNGQQYQAKAFIIAVGSTPA